MWYENIYRWHCVASRYTIRRKFVTQRIFSDIYTSQLNSDEHTTSSLSNQTWTNRAIDSTMQSRSEQSVSSPAAECMEATNNSSNFKKNQGTRRQHCECQRHGSTQRTCGKAPKVTEMLKQSLAILLTRVRIESGQRTAEKILDVLRDEYFDLTDFQNSVTTLEHCERITHNMGELKWHSQQLDGYHFIDLRPMILKIKIKVVPIRLLFPHRFWRGTMSLVPS